MVRRTFVFSLFLMFFVAATGSAYGAEYVGAERCRGCHIKQYNSWKQTTMAKSFENLKPGVNADAKKKAGLDPQKDYTTDKNCLKCHTTGYGKQGGFKSLAETPDLINVQCEVCHGPGSDFRKIMQNREFKRTDAKAAGLTLPNENANNCMDCHGTDSPFNEKVDPKYKFDIKDRLKKTHEHVPLKYKH